jgi:hypothetical protein
MQTPFEAFHEAVLRCVENLIELDPPLDSPEGRLLDGLSAAVEEYEKVTYPIGTHKT